MQIADLDTTLNVSNLASAGFRTSISSFTAQASSQQLTFSGSGPKPNCGVLLDDVSITT